MITLMFKTYRKIIDEIVKKTKKKTKQQTNKQKVEQLCRVDLSLNYISQPQY